jgi:molecular chaperone GrpE
MSKRQKPEDPATPVVDDELIVGEHSSIEELIPVQEETVVEQVGHALQEADERYLRLAAEYDNYRRRTMKEKTEATDRGVAWILTRLMDEFDDVDRLAASDPEKTTYEAYRNGFELFQRKLWKELEASGLERIEPAGEPFDPAIHEAVAVVAPESPEQDHTVKATFQAGYRYKGVVLRPARVQVYSEQGTA